MTIHKNFTWNLINFVELPLLKSNKELQNIAKASSIQNLQLVSRSGFCLDKADQGSALSLSSGAEDTANDSVYSLLGAMITNISHCRSRAGKTMYWWFRSRVRIFTFVTLRKLS